MLLLGSKLNFAFFGTVESIFPPRKEKDIFWHFEKHKITYLAKFNIFNQYLR